jgi:hypothetical protein
MKSRTWSGVVSLVGLGALLLVTLSIFAVVPIRGTVVRYGPLYSGLVLSGCILVCCVAEFIRSWRSRRPLWLRVTFVTVTLAGLVFAFLISSLGHAVRVSDTTILPELQLKNIDAAIDARAVSPTPSPR